MMDPLDFFGSTEPPKDLQEIKERVESFIEYHKADGKKVALITSGGTLVPLEQQTVRHLDNFSTGTRGSTSAEQFLSRGYAVIFLYRDSSFFPYTRLLLSNKETLFDWLNCDSDGHISLNPPSNLKDTVVTSLTKYKEVKSSNRLLSISFVSVFDYLHYLRLLSQLMKTLDKHAFIYLAAAVSDFYIHPKDMSEHKIKSSSSLVLKLDQVPKMIYPLTHEWAPKAFTVSFKLETDESVLVLHAKSSLERYNHQVVVANLLEKRKEELHLVSKDKVELIQLLPDEKRNGIVVEEKLILILTEKHSEHCSM